MNLTTKKNTAQPENEELTFSRNEINFYPFFAVKTHSKHSVFAQASLVFGKKKKEQHTHADKGNKHEFNYEQNTEFRL